MNDTNKDGEAEASAAEDVAVDETTADVTPPPDEAAPKRRRGTPAIGFALVVSLAALAGVGWIVFEDWRVKRAAEQSSDSIGLLSSRIDELRQSLSDLDRGTAELADRDAAIDSRVESFERDLDERVGLLDSLPSRMSNLERSMATLQGASAGARDAWLLAEAEYYMQIANAQLQLGGNPHLAALALGMADDRILQLADPALTDVRRALAAELAALDAMKRPDIEGVTLTLASLARVVDSLPLEGITDDRDDDADEAIDPDLGAAARAWASVKGTFSGLVRVTPPDETRTPLITPDAENLLRANLALQLQAARLALLRGEQAVFEQSLDDAQAWLGEYFDTGSAQVASASETIAEIRGGLFAVSPPDISESLRLLRQHKTLAETGQ